jgi:hypothetical protein
MSKCNCGSPKCSFNALVGDIDSEIRSGGSKPLMAKAMTPNAAEAHAIAVREHARLSLAALEAVKAGRVGAAEASRWEAELNRRGMALELSRPRSE